ncbi:hypothetical protein P3342_011950 [Pyrenophora teres f. teres]|uniref:Uncharacterized protein n=1 Tax=Pyrenophora teres f. teres TaxID=97479 RepID=A0A6S6WCC7_9PLEO|nr:hypothetical protein PTNB85_08828 [Pyrenophora teres f. teres]KAE8855329.1 hypothetical protein PTNB29_09580 [Pyrenophora teres f. teres]KAK1917105.1 hypothetical protein P3342_011950 [Pyrenophora teres f. teres]CAE7209886.1 hypothetical protein PTTW11_09971 [Pyrenophora teres f. teres]
MRRPPIACRRVVHVLQNANASTHHVSISDDVLARASNTFFPSSCPHQKRHGSHIPGPLEARKRAAKRRMTVSAGFCPQDPFPSTTFNWRAWFGLRKKSQPTWTYKAPSSHRNAADPLDPTFQPVPSLPEPPFNNSTTPAEHAASSTTTTTPCQSHTPYSFTQNIPQVTRHEFRSPAHAHDIKDGSEPACHAVTAKESNVAAMEGGDAQAHFEQFKSRTADASSWPNTHRIRLLAMTWQSCRPNNTEDALYNLMVIQHLITKAWDPTRILSKLKYFALPPTYTAESLALLECLEKLYAQYPCAQKVHRRLYLKAAEMAASAEASTSLSQDLQLLMTIQTTLQGIHSANPKLPSHAIITYRQVVNKIQDNDIRESLHAIEHGAQNVQRMMKSLIARAAADSSFRPAVENVILCFPRHILDSLVKLYSRSLAEAINKGHFMSGASHRAHLSIWLTLLETLDARTDTHHANYLISAVRVLAKHIFLSTTSGDMSARVLLIASVFQLTHKTPSLSDSRETMLRLIYDFEPPMLGQKEKLGLEFEETLALILAHMKKTTPFYTPIINVVANLYAEHAQLHHVYHFLNALDQQELTLDNASTIQARVKKQVASLPEDTASLTERQSQLYAFRLRTCQNILDLLPSLTGEDMATALQDTETTISALQAYREFTVILDRAAESNALPKAYATLTADIPSSQRTALIHQLAHHYSLATTRSHRETWRSIYYLYVFLETQSLPIGPLFTKAVVRSSIIRPLMEHRFVSARRLIWVCNLVARVEGEHVAKQVENNYWLWRGDLIKYAKDVHNKAGGDVKAKASISKLKGIGLI